MTTDKTMSKISRTFNKMKKSRSFYLVIILVAVSVALLGFLFLETPNAVSRSNTRVVTPKELEEDYGIQVKLIGVTAAGGLVDVRFKILNPDRAAEFFSDAEKLPKLMTDEGTLLSVSQTDPHEYKLVENGMVFMLFPNQGGVIKPGTPVTIIFDDIHLESIEAQ